MAASEQPWANGPQTQPTNDPSLGTAPVGGQPTNAEPVHPQRQPGGPNVGPRPAAPPTGTRANSEYERAVDAVAAELAARLLGQRRAPSPNRAVIKLAHLVSTTYGYGYRQRQYQTATLTFERPAQGVAERRFRCPTCDAEYAIDLPSLAALPQIRRRYQLIGTALIAVGVLIPLLTAVFRGQAMFFGVVAGLAVIATGAVRLSPMAQYRVKLRRVGRPATAAQRANHRLLSAARRGR